MENKRQMQEFDFENLEVYQRSINFCQKVFEMTNELPSKFQYSLGDQFRKSVLSICNNIAEGSNKFSDREKIQFYQYALNSARECVPMITLGFKLNFFSEETKTDLRSECIIICKMLKRLSDAVSVKKETYIHRKLSCVLLIIFAFHFPLSTFNLLHAAFKDSGWGARPVGMGGAFVAIADDNNATLWNPAGIAQMETRELALMYGRPYVGLDLKSGEDDTTFLQIGNVSAVMPFPSYGALGVSWANFLVSKLYQEDTFVISYANSLHDKLFSNENVELYTGFNVKVLRRSFSVDAETLDREKDSSGNLVPTSPFSSDSKSALAFDFGVLTKFADMISFGVSVKNLNNPDVGFKVEDRVPREYRMGAAFFVKDIGPFEDLTPAVEVSYRKASDQKADIRPHVGAETWLGLHTYGLRVGGNDREMTLGFSFNKTFPKFAFQIDYSFIGSLTLLSDNFGTHRVAVVWKQFTPGVSKKKIKWEEK